MYFVPHTNIFTYIERNFLITIDKIKVMPLYNSSVIITSQSNAYDNIQIHTYLCQQREYVKRQKV